MDGFEDIKAQADAVSAEKQAAAQQAQEAAREQANAVAAGVKADPVKGVGEPEGWNNDLYNALDGNFKPANLDTMRVPTNTSSVTVDFAQKIRDANKQNRK